MTIFLKQNKGFIAGVCELLGHGILIIPFKTFKSYKASEIELAQHNKQFLKIPDVSIIGAEQL